MRDRDLQFHFPCHHFCFLAARISRHLLHRQQFEPSICPRRLSVAANFASIRARLIALDSGESSFQGVPFGSSPNMLINFSKSGRLLVHRPRIKGEIQT
jgi:hypothetical protein